MVAGLVLVARGHICGRRRSPPRCATTAAIEARPRASWWERVLCTAWDRLPRRASELRGSTRPVEGSWA
jgi:hypothetical protein